MESYHEARLAHGLNQHPSAKQWRPKAGLFISAADRKKSASWEAAKKGDLEAEIKRLRAALVEGGFDAKHVARGVWLPKGKDALNQSRKNLAQEIAQLEACLDSHIAQLMVVDLDESGERQELINK